MTKKQTPKNFHHLINSSPIPDTCWRCKSAIWSCHVIGLPIKLAPTPLNFEEEFLARGRGVAIFQTARNQTIAFRTFREIEADDGSAVVLASHECDRLDFTIPHDLFRQETKPAPTHHETEGFPF